MPRLDTSDKRSAARVKLESRVLVTCDGGNAVFRTISEDSSASGIRLKHSIPATFLDKNLSIHISHPSLRSRLRLKVKLVGSKSDPLRFIFLGQSSQDEHRIETWVGELARKSNRRVA